MRLAIASIGICLAFMPHAQAEQSPTEFLMALSGNFSGKGEALISVTQEQVRIQCKINNSFDANAGNLQIKGKCATTRGKRKIDGSLVIENQQIKGTFLSPSADSEITKTTSAFEEGHLVTYISFVNKTSGALTRIRQIVSTNGDGGFKSLFQRFDNASKTYRDTGVVHFNRIVETSTN